MTKLKDEDLEKMTPEEIYNVWVRVIQRKDSWKYECYAQYLYDWMEIKQSPRIKWV